MPITQQSHTPGAFWCEKIENVAFSASELQVQRLVEIWEPQYFCLANPDNKWLCNTAGNSPYLVLPYLFICFYFFFLFLVRPPFFGLSDDAPARTKFISSV